MVFTLEAGKIKVLGKAARKPASKLAGNLEPVTAAEIFVAKTRGMGKITGSIVLNNFSAIKFDLDSLEKVFNAFGFLDKLVAEQAKDEKIFLLLSDFLESLDEAALPEEKKEILALGFLFKLLDETGYGLETGKCVRCGTRLAPEKNFFSVARGGVLCEKCAAVERAKIRITDGAVKLARIFQKNKIKNLKKIKASKEDLNNLKIIFREAFDWTVK